MLTSAGIARDTPKADDGFLASVVKIDITPDQPKWLRGYAPRQSEDIHDRIFHRIVALSDGVSNFYLISSDLCTLSPAFYDQFTVQLEAETGIRHHEVLWSVTHSHSVPDVGPPGVVRMMMPERWENFDGEVPNPAYTQRIKGLLIDGIREAQATLEPARLGVGVGFSRANINRRAIDVNGRASLGMNPEGPVDRQIGLIRLEREDGSLLALIANYAMHATVLGSENLLISGDAPGIVSEYVEEKLGAPLLFINGAAGNAAPIYSVHASPESGRLMQFKVLLGDRILDANRSIERVTSQVNLRLGQTIVESPLKEGFEWVDEMADYRRVTSGGIEMVRIPVRSLRINDDIAIWSAPLELFSEYATEVRNQSPFPYTFYYGYANGSLGYLPTATAFAEGGYEAERVSLFTPQVEADFLDGVIEHLRQIYE